MTRWAMKAAIQTKSPRTFLNQDPGESRISFHPISFRTPLTSIENTPLIRTLAAVSDVADPDDARNRLPLFNLWRTAAIYCGNDPVR